MWPNSQVKFEGSDAGSFFVYYNSVGISTCNLLCFGTGIVGWIVINSFRIGIGVVPSSVNSQQTREEEARRTILAMVESLVLENRYRPLSRHPIRRQEEGHDVEALAESLVGRTSPRNKVCRWWVRIDCRWWVRIDCRQILGFYAVSVEGQAWKFCGDCCLVCLMTLIWICYYCMTCVMYGSNDLPWSRSLLNLPCFM